MSIQVKNDHINGTEPFNILDFNITETGIEGIFTGSNCVPVKQTKSTYLIPSPDRKIIRSTSFGSPMIPKEIFSFFFKINPICNTLFGI